MPFIVLGSGQGGGWNVARSLPANTMKLQSWRLGPY